MPERPPADEPHDILAAEEFAFPAGRDSAGLHLPDDPTGIDEPHDILAAEDFAMPAGPDYDDAPPQRRGGVPAAAIIAGLIGLLWLRRRR